MALEKVKLGECIDVISGFAFKTKDFCNSGIPIIKIKNVNPPYVSLEDLTYIPVDLANKIPKYELSYDDILIAMTGSHINQWASVVGRVAKVKYRTRSMLNQRVGKIILKENAKANLDYIYYFLTRDEVKIELAAKAGGAANQANISPTDIKNLEIPFPPIKTQNKIADILSAYDNLIENNQKQIKLLEEAAQRLYKQWFIDLRYPGHETTKIVDGFPEGWRKGCLADIVRDVGINEKKENRTNYSYYLPIDCLPKKSLTYTDFNNIELAESSLVAFSENDIVFGAMRPYFHKVVVARDPGLTRSTCFVINTLKQSMWSYAVMLLFDAETIKYATKISVGTTMPYVRWKDFISMPILIPHENVTKDFNRIICPIIERLKKISKQNINLKQARDRLLPKLMNGELEV